MITKVKNISEDILFTPLRTEYSDTLPGTDIKGASRFRKIGKNAQHPLTVGMRKIKTSLGFSTRQLVNELREYEDKFGFSENERHGISRDFVPMNAVSMSSYLQGWVMQHSYMEAVHERLSKFYQFKLKSKLESPSLISQDGIKAMFDKWFSELCISNLSTRSNGAPMRTFAKLIAPYYKRPVTTKFNGIFNLGESYSTFEQSYTITDNEGVIHHFVLNRAEKVLFKSGDYLKRSDIIQYSVLYPLILKTDEKMYFDTTSPSTDHTAFFRWYTSNKAPRSTLTFEYIEEAVKQAKIVMSSNPKA